MKICRRQPNRNNPRNVVLSLFGKHNWGFKILFSALMITAGSFVQKQLAQTQTVPSYFLADNNTSQDIYNLAQSSTVRIIKDHSAGTGTIVYQEGEIYTVLTSWHVVKTDSAIQIMTADGQTYRPLQPPQQLGNFDLALVQFQSADPHQVATVAREDPQVGEQIFAAGFPLYQLSDRSTNTIGLGIQAFSMTQGEVSFIPPKSLPDGYHLGYTNDTQIGMSGGPIFNTQGLLVGVHGRGKYRDPAFGVYTFEDGSEPTPEMLETMINSSWGIPITTYLQFTSQALQN